MAHSCHRPRRCASVESMRWPAPWQVVVSLQSRAMVALISTVASGHDTEHRPSANGTFGAGSSSRTGALGTYLGMKGVHTATRGP